MQNLDYIDYGSGIHALDTQYQRPGLAACYLVRDADELAFIDCGTTRSLPLALALLESLKLSPAQVRYVMPTHVHLDHAGGAGAMMGVFPNATLVAHSHGVQHLIHPARLEAGTIAVYGEETYRRLYGQIHPVAAERTLEARDGLLLPLGKRQLECIDSPGHARHHYCLYDSASGGIFSGDSFGLSYPQLITPNGAFIVATTTPVQFDPEAWLDTLDRLLARQPGAIYLTHFGQVTELERLTQELRADIRSHAQIARMAPQEDRLEWLEQQLMQHQLSRLKQAGGQLSEQSVRALLGMDIRLNAQGLEVWLARLARQA